MSNIDPWSMTRWKSLEELLLAMRNRADGGQTITLSPQTARMLMLILDPQNMPRRRTAWTIDLYQEGSCVYQLDSAGEIFQVDAWARGSIAARAAFDYLKVYDPKTRYSQRRGSWVEAGDE